MIKRYTTLLAAAFACAAAAEPLPAAAATTAKACASPVAALSAILQPQVSSCVSKFCASYLLRTTTTITTITPSTTVTNSASTVSTTVTVSAPSASKKKRNAEPAAAAVVTTACPAFTPAPPLSSLVSLGCSCVVTASTTTFVQTATAPTSTISVPVTQTFYVPQATGACTAGIDFAIQVSSGPLAWRGRLLSTKHFNPIPEYRDDFDAMGLAIPDSPISYATFRRQGDNAGTFKIAVVDPTDASNLPLVGPGGCLGYGDGGNWYTPTEIPSYYPFYCILEPTLHCHTVCGAVGDDFNGGWSLNTTTSVIYAIMGGGSNVGLSAPFQLAYLPLCA